MKFKSFFLGMLATVAIASCNNEVIDGSDSDNNGGSNVKEGVPVYATLNVSVYDGAKTYAGSDEVLAIQTEKDYKEAVLYIYKVDAAANMAPENIVYIPDLKATNPYNGKVTVKTTSGTKQIYLALNPKKGTTNLLYTTGASEVSSDFSVAFPDLNNVLYTNGTSVQVLAPTATKILTFQTPVNYATKADGLISSLSRGVIKSDGAAYAAPNSDFMLMTNWNGPIDANSKPGKDYESNCTFTLKPSIDTSRSNGGTTSLDPKDDNNFQIAVQRAFAKVSVSLSDNIRINPYTLPTGSTAAGYSNLGYRGAVGNDAEGVFQPWGDATNGFWTVGNIAKFTLPFQQYAGGYVRDYFDEPTGLYIDSMKTSQLAKWSERFDNTRVLPAVTALPTNFTVDNVWNTMKATGNNQYLTQTGGGAANKYFHVTENARGGVNLQDWQTYVIIGGRYLPKTTTTAIARDPVPQNPFVPTEVANFVPTTGNAVKSEDTLYYLISEKKFISGLGNVLKYFAWGPTGVAQSATPAEIDAAVANTPTYAPIVIPAVQKYNDYVDGNHIMAYFGGICWYRIFVKDPNGVAGSSVDILRRNHIYSVNISEIKGPGIANPNKIIVPGTPTSELITYVTATVDIKEWHKVDQDAKGEME